MLSTLESSPEPSLYCVVPLGQGTIQPLVGKSQEPTINMLTLQSCKFSKCLFPLLQVKQSSQSVNNVTHNRHNSFVYLLGVTRPMTILERIENRLYILLYFRGVGQRCRWCAGLALWRGIRHDWLVMTLRFDWRDVVLDRLSHWQSSSFFVWIVVLRFVTITAFCVHHLAASRSVGFGWFTELIWKSPLWQYWW